MLAGGQSLSIKLELNYIIYREDKDDFGHILQLAFGGTGEIS